MSARWFALLLRLYPADFRDEMGASLIEAYVDRCHAARARGGVAAVALVWLAALVDSVRNGVGERLRPAVAWRRAGNWGRDGQLALRRLIRAPVFSLTMIGTLVVGLGAFAVVFTVVDKVLIEPLPYARPNDLWVVWRDYTTFFDMKRGWLGGPDVASLDSAGGPIAGAVALRNDRRTLSVGSDQQANPEEVRIILSTPNLFDVLGVRPIVGRGFARAEVGPGRTPVIVLGYDLWRRRFGGDRHVVGTTVRLNATVFTVIGVMGPAFHFVEHSSLGAPIGADAYITFPLLPGAQDAHNGAFGALIRARPGATPAQVAAAVAAVGRSVDERYFKNRGLRLYPVGLQPDLVAPVRPALVLVGASGAFLLLVLAVNLATLLLARAVAREREFAVSRALGADAMALVRATLFEAMILGAIGGLGATLLASWGARALIALGPADLPRREMISVDWRVGLIVTGVGALLGLTAGAAPAFWASRSTLANLLRNAAVRGGGRGRLRRGLVVVQVALGLVLLSTGGLVARSFAQLLRSQPGFDPRGVLTMRVPIAPWRYPNNESAVAVDERLEQALSSLPGVVSVGASTSVPLSADADQATVAMLGAPGNTGREEHDAPLVDVLQARTGWFRTLGIRMIDGRDFGPRRAKHGERREAIIDRTLADAFYPGGHAVGTLVVCNNDTLQIVGVVDQARLYDLNRDGRSQLYLRDEDDTYGTLYFALKTTRPSVELVPDVRAAVHRVDPMLAVSDVRSLDDVVNASLGQQRVSAVLVGGFSAGALLLAAMGLFGVVAGSVARRQHEMAVRLALGADRSAVVRMVVGDGAVLVAIGVLVAIPGIYVSGRVLRGVLVGISPFDPTTLAAVVAALAIVALAACYLPARRAGSIDPASALREG